MINPAKLTALPSRVFPFGPFHINVRTHCLSLKKGSDIPALNHRLEMVSTGQIVTRADGAKALAVYKEAITSEQLNDAVSGVTIHAMAALAFLDAELAAVKSAGAGVPKTPPPTPNKQLIKTKDNDGTINRAELNMYGRTKVGTRPKHTVNEDSLGFSVTDTGTIKMIVADGMGGHLGGAAASGIAVKEGFEPQPLGPSISIRYAHNKIDAASGNSHGQAKMGSTIIALEVDQKIGVLTVANVGDSPLYRVRANGEVQRLNRPEIVGMFSKTTVLTLIEKGEIYKALADDAARTKKMAEVGNLIDSQVPYSEAEILLLTELNQQFQSKEGQIYCMHALKYALGHSLPAKITEQEFVLAPGDTILACSDGMSLMPEEIRQAVKGTTTLGAAVERLLNESFIQNGAESDDVTVLAYRQGEPEPPLIEIPDIDSPEGTQVVSLSSLQVEELAQAKRAAESRASQLGIDLGYKTQLLERSTEELHTERAASAGLRGQLAALSAEVAELRAAGTQLPTQLPGFSGDALAAIENDVQTICTQWDQLTEGLSQLRAEHIIIEDRQTTAKELVGSIDPKVEDHEARREAALARSAAREEIIRATPAVQKHLREIERLTGEVTEAKLPEQGDQRTFLTGMISDHQEAIDLELAAGQADLARELAEINQQDAATRETRDRKTALLARFYAKLGQLEAELTASKGKIVSATSQQETLGARAREMMLRLQLFSVTLQKGPTQETKKE